MSSIHPSKLVLTYGSHSGTQIALRGSISILVIPLWANQHVKMKNLSWILKSAKNKMDLERFNEFGMKIFITLSLLKLS